jgi:hypothetical protein
VPLKAVEILICEDGGTLPQSFLLARGALTSISFSLKGTTISTYNKEGDISKLVYKK